MPLNILKSCRSSVQFKLFLSLTAIVALSLTAILASQVYLVQDYFIRQAESNLRSSNYLLSRVLADPLFNHDLSLLQVRLQDVQTKLPLCNFQLKDNIGTVVFRVGEVNPVAIPNSIPTAVMVAITRSFPLSMGISFSEPCAWAYVPMKYPRHARA